MGKAWKMGLDPRGHVLQPTYDSDTTWSVPSEEVTKMWYKYQSQEADTHLLHRMVHHRTIFRGGGHSRQTIIRSKKATVIHQSTTQTGSSSGSEYRASGSILQRANTTGSFGCGRNLYSMSSTTKSGSSSEATTYIGVEYKSTQQVQSPPRRGI